MITFNLVVRLGFMTSRFDRYDIKITWRNEIKDLMVRIKMYIFKAKLPFYPPYEVKYRLQNGVSTELRIQEPKFDLEKIYNRFTKSKKEVTVNDLHKEIKETKSEVRTLKQDLTILRVDHNLFDQRLNHLENNSHQGNEEGTSFQNHSDEEVDKTVNPTADMVQEKSSVKFLETINRINFQKWHSKVRIVISRDFEFEVIALINSGADLNCIQEGIIPSKYFKKTKERLTSASGERMQIEFKIPKAHVC